MRSRVQLAGFLRLRHRQSQQPPEIELVRSSEAEWVTYANRCGRSTTFRVAVVIAGFVETITVQRRFSIERTESMFNQ